MAWFYDTFLPSLFERAGTNKDIWLTRKQTEICTRYMDAHTVRTEEFQGYQKHLYYTAKWDGRDVTLNYSKLNGCGTISFSFNGEESKEHQLIIEEEREQREIERVERLRTRRPEKFSELREIAKKKYEEALEDLRLDTEESEDEKTIEQSREWVEVCKKELERYI